jgi:hypothetical protein
MIHAGVADGRQWNNEFTNFPQSYQVIRYDGIVKDFLENLSI